MKKIKRAYKIIKANIITISICIVVVAFTATSIKSIVNAGIRNNNSVVIENINTTEETEINYMIAYKVSDKDPYAGKFTSDMDLLNRMNITEMDMDKILDHYTRYEENANSIFKNKGKLFCQISNETGLDPIFIMMIAVNTYGWNYSINDVELIEYTDAEKQFACDVRNMSKWIYDSYYIDKSCHTLNDMINIDNYKYAASTKWADAIADAMDEAYKILFNGGSEK